MTIMPNSNRRSPAPFRLAGAAVLVGLVGATLAAGALPADAATSTVATSTVAASSRHYSFSTLNDPADPTFNQLLGINDHGLIAGYFGSGTPAQTHPNKGYTLGGDHDGDNYRNENFPGSAQTQVVGINDARITVGFWVNSAGANAGFVKWNGHFRSVSNPAGTAAPRFDQLLGINNHGVAVGFYSDAAGNAHAYTYNLHTRRFTPVVVPGANNVTATGINDEGHISGFATLANGTVKAFVIEHGHVSLVAVHGSANSQALGINNADQVVGSYLDASGATHGFTSHELRRIATVDDPHAVGSTVINGVNNRGQLVGFYTDAAGNTDGLLANRH